MAATVSTRDIIGEATLGELESTLRGALVRPEDPDYDPTNLFQLNQNIRPSGGQ